MGIGYMCLYLEHRQRCSTKRVQVLLPLYWKCYPHDIICCCYHNYCKYCYSWQFSNSFNYFPIHFFTLPSSIIWYGIYISLMYKNVHS